MVSPNLEKMRSQLDALRNNRSTRNSDEENKFWKLTEGDHQIRLLAYEDGEILKEYHWHYGVNGKNILCANKSFNKKCPVCDLATEIWQEYQETVDDNNPDEDLKKMAVDLFASKRYYVPVLVRGEDERALLYSCGVRASEQILTIVLDEENEEIFDPQDGFDLKLKYSYSKPGDKRSATTTINASRNSSPLFDRDFTEEDVEELYASVTDPADVFEIPDPDEVQEHLDTLIGEIDSQLSDNLGSTAYGDGEESDSPVLDAFNKLQED